MIGRNNKCLCGSGKKYKKCCINKRLELSEDIEYYTKPISSEEKTVVQKIQEMSHDDKINFLASLLEGKEVKCLECKEGVYISQGVETYMSSTGEKYEWFHCNKCENHFAVNFNENFVTGISDDYEDDYCIEDYESLMTNDNIDDFFGLDFEDIVYPRLTILQIRNPGFMSLPAVGEFRVDNDTLIFDMLAIDGKTAQLTLGKRGDEGMDDALFDNLDDIRGRVLQVGDTYQVIIVLSEGDEEEAEAELDRLVSFAYMDYRGIESKEDMIDLLEEADIGLMTIDDFEFEF